MALSNFFKSKKFIVILSSALALLIAVGGSLWFFLGSDDDAPKKVKKKGIIILTEEEVDDSDELLDDVDIEDGNGQTPADLVYPTDSATDDQTGNPASGNQTTDSGNQQTGNSSDSGITNDAASANQSADPTGTPANQDNQGDSTGDAPQDNGNKVDFIDEEDIDEYEIDQILTLNNKTSVNDRFMGFGAVYYPWIYWQDAAGRNYTEEQRQIELNRLTESGVTWIRTMIYARSEWYDKTQKVWKYSGEHYEGIVKFLKEMDKRGIEVLLNYEWGGAIQPDASGNMTIFNDSTLNKVGTMDERIEMYADFCTTFTQKLKEDGVDCVKYITFFSEPANRKELGGQYGTEQFDTVFLKLIVPAYTKIVKAVHEAFTDAGIRKDYKFLGNNQSTYYYVNLYTWEQLKPLYDPVKEYLDEYDYHFYNRLSNPKGANYDDFAIIPETFAVDVEEHLGVKANDTWIDEFNIVHNGTEGIFKSLSSRYGGIYALKDEPYTATQMGNTLLAFLNNGYKTACLWTFVNTLWPNSTNTGGEFNAGVMLDGLMPNLIESQVPYNAYYTFSMISRYCKDAKAVYPCDMYDADGLAGSCVYGKDGSVTVFVVNSNLFDVEYKVNFESKLSNSVLYRHLYDPKTFESNTSAKLIGVDRVLIHVTDGFVDKIPAGGVAVYTTSKQ